MTSPARLLTALLAVAATAVAAPAAQADVFGALSSPSEEVAADTPSGHYLVTFAAGTSEAEQAAVLTDAGATEVSQVAALRMHTVTLPAGDTAAVVDSLRARPSVARVEAEATRAASAVPSDPAYGSQWTLPRIGWDQVFGVSTPAASATVALLDTGVEAGHIDLAANVVPGASMLEPGANGTSDPNGHGTAMAGIVAASTDNGEGIAGIGYAGVKVMPVTVLDSQGVGQDGEIINGVVWAADHGADVILMPFSSPDFSASLQAAIDYAWSKGAVLVAATGNDASSSPHFPAGDRGVVGVANTDDSDALNASSNRGAAAFMAAPGTAIHTTSAGGGYRTLTGTSASAAAVAGASALMRAISPDASNGVIVGRLARNADPTPGNDTGNGRLNLARALGDDATDPVKPEGAAPVGAGGPFVGPYLAAANNDAHVAPGWAPTNTAVTFSTLYRVTTGNNTPIQHVRITLPSGYTNISAAGAAFSSGTWGTPVVDSSARTVDVSLTSGTGPTENAGGWARIDVNATTPGANQQGNAAEWLMETFTNAAGTQGKQDDNPPVLIGHITDPSATITFVDANGDPVVSPVLQNEVPATVRARITSSSTTTSIKYTDIAVPACFSTPSGVTTTSSAGGTGGYTSEVTDGFVRLSGGQIPLTGSVTVQFDTTPNCTSGVYTVSSDPSTNATNPPSGTNQSVSTTGGSLTVVAGRADVSITKTDSPDPVQTNSNLTYTLGVSNAGPDAASAVKVVDTLPPGTTFVSATGTNWNCTHSSGTVTCNRTGGNLAAGASAPAITIVVTAPSSPGNITNSATVSSPNDETPGNNTATASTKVVNQSIELRKTWVGPKGNATLKIGSSAGGSQVASTSLVGTDGTTGRKIVAPGTYFLSETFDAPTSAADYEATLDCFNDADDDGTKDAGESAVQPGANNGVTLGVGDHVVCTFTNKRKPRVNVTKDLYPSPGDNGKFNLQINGTTHKPDAGDGDSTGYVNVAVDTDPTVGELASTGTDLADYESSIACTGDSTASSSTAGPLNLGQLGPGAVVDCTMTNKRKPRVKVTKDLYPSPGDSGTFDLQVNGTTHEFDAGDGDSTPYVNVAVGSNPTVGEAAGTDTDLADYESSIACTGDSTASSSDAGPLQLGTLAAGAVVDCTITNKRKPRVRVTKDLFPATDGGKFSLQINGDTKAPNAGDGGTTGYVNVAVGSDPSVGEIAGTGTDLGDYESSISCSGDSTASSSDAGPLQLGTLAAGAVVDCTITNKRKPRVKVTKDLVPATDSGKFDLQVNGTTHKPNAGDGESTSYVNVAVDSNPTVGEIAGTGTSLGDYESSISCSGDSTASSSDAGPLSVGALAAGAVVDCTITNKRKPRVKVTKDLGPATDGGRFNLQVNGTTEKANAGDGESTPYVNVAVDSNPTVGEIAGTGTTLGDYESSIACTGDSSASSSDAGPLNLGTLAAGAVVDCTIRNERKPRVKVTKDLFPSGDGGRFNLQVNGTTEKANAGDGESTPYVNVAVDSTPTVGEIAGTGTTLGDYESSITCSGDSDASSSDAGPLQLGALGAGAVVDCTIRNERKPRVRVTKDLFPSTDGGKFNLQVNGTTQKANAGDGESTPYVNVAVGSNPSVGEIAGTGTNLNDYESSIACSGDSDASSSDAGPLNVGTLTAGAVVDCTITNKRKPRVKVTKDLFPGTDGGKFDLQVNGATHKANAGDGESTPYVNVAVGGNPSVGEVAGTGTSLDDYESSIACTGDSSASSSDAGPLQLGTLAAGAVVDCTITNKRKPRVRVTKDLFPSTDGGKFNLQVNGTTQKANAGDGESTPYVNVAVGSNPSVGEIASAGTDLGDYESSIACSGDSSASSSDAGPLSVGALAAGAVVDCTITNKRKPRLKVTKDLYPTPGDAGKFDLQVNGTTHTTDAGDGESTPYVNVAVGSNPTVGEIAGTGTDLGDYESSISCSGDSSASSSDAGPLSVGALAAGAVVDCTITNKRKPRVKVTKELTAGDDGLFDLQVNGVTKKQDATDGDHTGYVNVGAGSNPTVGEVAGTDATSLSDYDSSIACSGDSTATSNDAGPLNLGTLAAGAVVDCTITNNRKARLAVVKKVAPTSGDLGTFDLRIDGVTKKQDAAHNQGTGFINVANGTHDVSELNGTNSPNQLSDYESSITCDNGDTNTPAGGTSLTTSALGYGDKVTCEISNTRKARVKITKDLYPSNDGGKFNLQVNGTTHKADAVDGQSTPYVNVAVGSNPTVGEIAGTGTDLADYESSIACSGDSSASSSDAGPLSVGQLSAGQVVDCTVTNERKPRVRVTKSLTPTGDGGKFNLQVNGTTEKADAGDGGTTDYVNVAVDSTPTVGETAGTGTNLTDYESSIKCTGDSSAESNGTGPLSLGQLSAGQSADCTIANKRKPEIKVVKKLDPATDDGRFKLKIDATTFDNGGAGYGDGGTTGFQHVTASSHSVSEAAHGTTSLGDYDSKVVCDSGKGTTDPGTSHSFSVDYGEKVTCEITNKRRAIVTGVKYEDDEADGAKTGDSGVSGWTIKAYEDTNANGAADAGEYRISATTGSGGAYSLSLSPRTYIICEVGQQNWAQTQPNPLTNNRCQGVSPARAGYLVEFSSGPIQADRDFGNTRLGSNSHITNSAFQLVDDLTPWAIGDFEILLNPQNTIVATNPGQFYYHQRATNTTGATTPMDFTINWPCQFRTQTSGGQPLHAYVQLQSDPPDMWRDWTPNSSNISWANNPCPAAGVGKITANDVPPGAKVWVTAHLDYALKGTTAPSSKFGNPPIPYGPFQSTIVVAGGTSYSSSSLLGRGKKVTVVYGRMSHKVGGDPIEGVWVRLTQGTNTATAKTDIGGGYLFYDGQACTTADGLEGGCTGASSTSWTFASASTKLEALGDGAAAAATTTWPAGKANASVVTGSTVFANLTTSPLYTFSVSKGSAYNRDWKFGP